MRMVTPDTAFKSFPGYFSNRRSSLLLTVGSQPRHSWKSRLIAGKAIWMEETVNGGRSAERLTVALPIVGASAWFEALVSGIPGLPEFPDEIEDKTDHNTDDDAGSQRKIEGEVLFSDHDVAWKFAQKRRLLNDQQHQTCDDEKDTENDDGFCKITHGTPLLDAGSKVK